MRSERRKWLPAEAYRFLVLVALQARAGRPASKRELAWETRANHYMITKVLADLGREGLVSLTPVDGGYEIRATSGAGVFADRHRDYFVRTFGSTLREHFRYGRAPAWARALAEQSESLSDTAVEPPAE